MAAPKKDNPSKRDIALDKKNKAAGRPNDYDEDMKAKSGGKKKK